ncbi:MAG: hypothetical protein QOF83_2746, partial [Solirubrobacteraceae bacterium]|nr:hypothetical protein [Solirubrobacteraceae bacterium]
MCPRHCRTKVAPVFSTPPGSKERAPLSTEELRRAWRTLHHTGPPLGLSRDLIIRGLADKLQQRAQGGPTRALQRRLRILAGEFERGARSFDPGGVLKTGATLVRQWR